MTGRVDLDAARKIAAMIDKRNWHPSYADIIRALVAEVEELRGQVGEERQNARIEALLADEAMEENARLRRAVAVLQEENARQRSIVP